MGEEDGEEKKMDENSATDNEAIEDLPESENETTEDRSVTWVTTLGRRHRTRRRSKTMDSADETDR